MAKRRLKDTHLKVGDGIEIPKGRTVFFFACCDCGLVHQIRSEATRPVILYFVRDERRTGQRRRRRKEAEEKTDAK